MERARDMALEYGAPLVAVFACFGYVACVLYAAFFQWPFEFGGYLWRCFLGGLRREAHPMALKYFLIAALSVVLFVLAWMVTATVMLYTGHPKTADVMNDLLAVAIIWWVARTEGKNEERD